MANVVIVDSLGNDLVYWPISGLVEGENGEVLAFTIENVVVGGHTKLYATPDSRIKVWARRVGDSSYIDITSVPYDLSALSGDIAMQLYVEARIPIVGLERVPISVVVGSSSTAGWL